MEASAFLGEARAIEAASVWEVRASDELEHTNKPICISEASREIVLETASASGAMAAIT